MTEENDDELYDPTYSAPSAETSKGPDTRSDETNMTTTEDKGQAQAQEEEEEEEEEEEDEDEVSPSGKLGFSLLQTTNCVAG